MRTGFPGLILMVLVLVLSACAGEEAASFENLPQGDAARGETLFAERIGGAPACTGCHIITEDQPVGPAMAGIGSIAADRVEGQSGAEYLYHSIVNPGEYVVDGYSNEMYANYGRRLDDQQIADLIAYLLTLTEG